MRLRRLGLAALLLSAFVLGACGDDDDDSASDDSEQTDDTTTDDTTADDTADDTADTTADDTGDDTSSDEGSAFAAAIAEGIKDAAGGQITDEEAQCMADGILEEFGASELVELGASGGSFETLDPETQQAVFDVVLDCVPADKLAAIGQGG